MPSSLSIDKEKSICGIEANLTEMPSMMQEDGKYLVRDTIKITKDEYLLSIFDKDIKDTLGYVEF